MLRVAGRGLAAARTGAFRDAFTSFDAARWSATSHLLGRSALDPANVSTDGGKLRLRLPAGSVNGGEIQSASLLRDGAYRIRLRAPDAPSSITGFFLYRPPDLRSEIDLEISNDASGRAILSTYSGGTQTNSSTVQLPFDPTAAFHEYGIELRAGGVTFTVDGAPIRTWTRGVPRTAMNLYLNAWFPVWLAGLAPGSDRFAEVDWVEYAPT